MEISNTTTAIPDTEALIAFVRRLGNMRVYGDDDDSDNAKLALNNIIEKARDLFNAEKMQTVALIRAGRK